MNIDFQKENGLVPVIIQDSTTLRVLMLGYMNEEAFRKTESEGVVTFFSRSRKALWTKGETSGHYLHVESMSLDCDRDALLIHVKPDGPTCHTGSVSCFGDADTRGFVFELEQIISKRIAEKDPQSYTYGLFVSGVEKIAQKVGEEAVELVIEAMKRDDSLLRNEAADLLFHYLILLQSKGVSLADVEAVLSERHKKRGSSDDQ